MTATDELRRMLDERGVEYEAPHDGLTIVRTDNALCKFYETLEEPERGVFAVVTTDWLTPERAIAATLGRETCRRNPHINLTIGDGFLKQSGWDCSECGCRLDLPVIARYCPNCGRKVVDV